MFQKNQEVHFSWGFRICGQNSNFHLCKTTKISLAWEFMIFEKKTYTWKKNIYCICFFFKMFADIFYLPKKNFWNKKIFGFLGCPMARKYFFAVSHQYSLGSTHFSRFDHVFHEKLLCYVVPPNFFWPWANFGQKYRQCFSSK